jgi:hypothetical protein
MPQVLPTLNDPVLQIADTEAGLTTGVEFVCQMTAATLNTEQHLTDVPQSGCYPPTKIVGDPTYTLDLAWIQDWSDPAGISRYAQDNNGETKWIQFLMDADDATTVVTTAVQIAAGQYGGTFGGLAQTTTTWPIVGNPTFPAYVAA